MAKRKWDVTRIKVMFDSLAPLENLSMHLEGVVVRVQNLCIVLVHHVLNLYLYSQRETREVRAKQKIDTCVDVVCVPAQTCPGLPARISSPLPANALHNT